MSKRKADGDLEGSDRSAFAKSPLGGPPSQDRAKEFATHLKALNKQFAKWVEGQAASHIGDFWTDGVQSYLKHAESIQSKFSDVLSPSPAAPAPAAAPPAPERKDEAPKPAAPFSFAAAPTPNAPTAAPASTAPPNPSSAANPFLSSATPQGAATTGLFQFGAKPAAAAAPNPEGKKDAPAATGSAFGFSFGAKPGDGTATVAAASMFGAKPPAFASATASPFTSQPSSAAVSSVTMAGDGEDGGDDEALPSEPTVKAERNVEDSAERLFESKGKLFFQGDDKQWNEVGAGHTSIQKWTAGDKTGFSLVFRDEITGKIKVNCPLYKGIKGMLKPDRPKMVVVVVYVEVPKNENGNVTMVSEKKTALFRFSKDTDASEFKKTLEGNAPQ